MTSSFGHRHAALLAATEVLPGEWRDLADLIVEHGLAWLDSDGVAAVPDSGLAQHLYLSIDAGRVEHWLKALDGLAASHPSARLVTVADPDYPQNLWEVYNRPPFIFVEGTLTERDRRAVAIVGSRDASDDAMRTASVLARDLASTDITVVSGLADGVDAAAHRGALDASDGRTFAVFGTGIDRVFPEHNADLARDIAARGATLSQFRPGSPPTRSTFPMRNAVISGLSRASIVIEASERSGTRSEAEHSVRQSRPVLLWAPTMRRRSWARTFVDAHDQAHFVESVDEILRRADLAGTRAALP